MYYAIHTPDLARAKAFYIAVFGWTYTSDGHIEGSSPAGGLGEGEPHIDLYFAVPDIGATVAKLRESGGTTPDPVRSKSGWSCLAEDGLLGLWQPTDGYTDDNPKCAEGDLFYYVVPVGDEDIKARYVAAFGWELSPGSPRMVGISRTPRLRVGCSSTTRVGPTCTSGWPMSTTSRDAFGTRAARPERSSPTRRDGTPHVVTIRGWSSTSGHCVRADTP